MVMDTGARIVLLVQRPLVPLLDGMPGIAQIVPYGGTVPYYDQHCSLMSLPRAFRTEPDTIPADVPYLHAPAHKVAEWARILGPRDHRRRIAIAWSGSSSVWNRSMTLAKLAPLLDRDDCAFHVAQTEISDADRTLLDGMDFLVDHSRRLHDFADTAALLMHMDLVISVDTVLVHLAGALGRPVWTMLPLGADYRWLTKGTTSAWYPTMRLYRQSAFDDWEPVVAAVGAALDAEPA